jgi:membrane protease YdiL (CAAX protease family)
VWVLPLVMAAAIVVNILGVHPAALSPDLLLWSLLGAIGVGFGEEVATRGSMIVGLRSRFAEGRVWLFSTVAFSALHVPNVVFGLPLAAMPVQVVLTFIVGSGFYAIRRVSGTLVLPMVLHGLWDSALLVNSATGGTPSTFQFLVYPVAIACAAAVLARNWNTRLPARAGDVVPAR